MIISVLIIIIMLHILELKFMCYHHVCLSIETGQDSSSLGNNWPIPNTPHWAWDGLISQIIKPSKGYAVWVFSESSFNFLVARALGAVINHLSNYRQIFTTHNSCAHDHCDMLFWLNERWSAGQSPNLSLREVSCSWLWCACGPLWGQLILTTTMGKPGASLTVVQSWHSQS